MYIYISITSIAFVIIISLVTGNSYHYKTNIELHADVPFERPE